MSQTQMNLMLVGCVSAVVVPGVLLFYLWSARVDRGTTPEMVCFNNLTEIDCAEQQWALERHKTTNDTPTWKDVEGVLRSTKFVCPSGGTYSLARIGEPPTCSVPQHNELYRKHRP